MKNIERNPLNEKFRAVWRLIKHCLDKVHSGVISMKKVLEIVND